MAISVNSNLVYTNFQSVEFTTDVVGDKIIEFGDGTFEFFTGLVVEHIYTKIGTYTACVRLCTVETPDLANCIEIQVLDFVSDEIMTTSLELSTVAGSDIDFYTHEVCLSANCPPPLRVELSVLNTTSREVNNIGEKTGNCDPVHFFFSNLPIKDNTVYIEDPDKIYVDGKIVGYRHKFCFGYYDDYDGAKQLKATYLKECGICNDIG